MIGFTRIESPGEFSDVVEFPEIRRAPLSRKPPTWVPAAEVRGEGIFIEFREDAVSAWRELTYCFLRLANLDNGAFDRIGRYETGLWRQIAQTLVALQTIRHY